MNSGASPQLSPSQLSYRTSCWNHFGGCEGERRTEREVNELSDSCRLTTKSSSDFARLMESSTSSSTGSSFVLVDSTTGPPQDPSALLSSLAPYFPSIGDPSAFPWDYSRVQQVRQTRHLQPDGRLFIDDLLALLGIDGQSSLSRALELRHSATAPIARLYKCTADFFPPTLQVPPSTHRPPSRHSTRYCSNSCPPPRPSKHTASYSTSSSLRRPLLPLHHYPPNSRARSSFRPVSCAAYKASTPSMPATIEQQSPA